jgi:PRTRC genetic system protein A
MATDPRDAALRASCPCIGMPIFSGLEGMAPGQRLLVGTNGLFVQVKTPWLEVTTRIAAIAQGLALPFGEVQEGLHFAFGVIPIALLDRFVRVAREALPNEAAGALIFDQRTGGLSLRMHRAVHAGPGHIDYRIEDLDAHELLAVDLHTHGCSAAFWSNRDDRDDMGVRVCGVFGHLDRARPSAKFRLALNGMFRDLPCPWEENEGHALA